MTPEQPTIMAVLAHPDDEAFGMGGTLAKYAALGCSVQLVTATRGEAGQISDPSLATNASLPQVREHELRCACQAYGIAPPILLDYLDGQLPIVHQGQAVAKVVALIRQLKPQVILTFGPDGIYGHYDHIAVHRWATIAVRLAADPDCFPGPPAESCETFQVKKLYHAALPASLLAEISAGAEQPAVMMDGVPFPLVARSEDEITTCIDISDYRQQKLAGICCHRTQVSDDSPYLANPDETMASPTFAQEFYVLAHSTVGWPQGHEDDLLRGCHE